MLKAGFALPSTPAWLECSFNSSMPQVANLANTKWCKKTKHDMVTDRRLTSESFPMDTNKTGFKWFTKLFVCSHAREGLMLQKVMESNILNSKANHSG